MIHHFYSIVRVYIIEIQCIQAQQIDLVNKIISETHLDLSVQ